VSAQTLQFIYLCDVREEAFIMTPKNIKQLLLTSCLAGGLGVLSACAAPLAQNAEPTSETSSEAPKFTDTNLNSPNGQISISITTRMGRPSYSTTIGDKQAIGDSFLGLHFLKAANLDQNMHISNITTNSLDETWQLPWGERKDVRNNYNESLIEFSGNDDSNRKLKVRFRAFDDGIAFRYEVPSINDRAIIDEVTEFAINDESTAWWIESSGFNRYEYIYNETPSQEIDRAHTPMTVKTPEDVYVSIHEAALVDYSGMSLDRQRPGIFEAELRAGADGVKVHTTGDFKTPWRTIQIADEAKGLLNSDIILNLNEPNKLGDVSWVEPGRYIGIWWGMHLAENTWGSGPTHGATTSEAKRYIDFAAEHGFAGVLIEGWNEGWDGDWFNNGDLFNFTKAYPDFNIEEVSAYGLEKGVRIIGHHETSGSVSHYEAQMDDAFQLYADLGVRQIKTGYVTDAGNLKRVDEEGKVLYEWHDSQFMTEHHTKLLNKAAKHKLSINTHEPIKDTGLRRTYPNWISREGARGQEFNAWGHPTLNPPSHIADLAFTRMLSGPMDFTPGIFDLTFENNDSENRVQTTLAKQLALYVVIYSPIQMAADLPRNYNKHLDAFQFIKDVPTDWEKTIALAGEPGDFVAFARQERDGDNWFIGAVTNEEARTLDVSLDFLEPDTDYEAQIYRDADDADWETNPTAYTIETKTVSSNDVLQIKMATSGGQAIRLSPIN